MIDIKFLRENPDVVKQLSNVDEYLKTSVEYGKGIRICACTYF